MLHVKKFLLYFSAIFLSAGCNEDSFPSKKTGKKFEVIKSVPEITTTPPEKISAAKSPTLPVLPNETAITTAPVFEPSEPFESIFEELMDISSFAGISYPLDISLRGGGGGARCRNGVREKGEECDDGNALIGDGCSITCRKETLFSLPRDDDAILVIDPETGDTLCFRDIEIEDFPCFGIDGGNGLATDPTSGTLWALLRDGSARELVTLDPTTGIATSIGPTNPTGFANIAFDKVGILYGVTGDGGSQPETLFTLNKQDATSTFFMALGNGDDGEAISYNNQDNFLYHASGRLTMGPFVFEKIDLLTKTITTIDNTSDTEEITAFTYWAQHDTFLATNVDSDFFRLSPTGVQTPIGQLDHVSKGLAFKSVANPCP